MNGKPVLVDENEYSIPKGPIYCFSAKLRVCKNYTDGYVTSYIKLKKDSTRI